MDVDPRYRRSVRLTLLWEARRWLMKAGLWGAALATVAAVLSPVRYTAAARLMPPYSPTQRPLRLLALAGGVTGATSLGATSSAAKRQSSSDAGSDSSDGRDSTEKRTTTALASQPLPLDKITSLEDFVTAAKDNSLFVGLLASQTVQNGVIEKFDLQRLYGSRTRAEARMQLSRRTDILLERKSGILTIEVTDHDRQRAIDLTREYIAQLNQVVAQVNTSAAHRERVFLEQRLKEIRNELQVAEKELAQFSSGKGLVDPKEQGKEDIGLETILQGQLIAEQSELEGLRQFYTNNNFRVQIAETQIAELKRQLQKLEADPKVAGSGAFPGVDAELGLRKLPYVRKSYDDLHRQVQVEEAVYESFTKKCEAAKVREAREIPSVMVLDGPELPEKKVFPQRLAMIATGFCLAVFGAMVWVFLRADWEQLDAQDPGKALGSRVYRTLQARFALAKVAPWMRWIGAHSSRTGQL